MSTAHCVSCGTEHRSDSGPCDPSIWVGRTLTNGIRIVESLGSTRDGPLFRAEYSTGREVALLIAVADDPLFSQAARIRHVNVARVHEVGQIPDGPGYVVLECLTGEPLSHLLARRGALPTDEAVDLFLQAAAGLVAAHEVGVIHANLSPEKILVTQTAAGPLVKLIGFAPVSSLSDAEAASDREVSAEYASPERIAGYVPDERSDVYSLGAILHHLLVGNPPGYGSEGFSSVAMRTTVAQAVLPIPEHRFLTVAEFAAAVRHALAGDVIPKRSRVRRPLILTAASIVTVISGGLWLGASKPWRSYVATAASDTNVVAADTPAAYAPYRATDSLAEEFPEEDSIAMPAPKPAPVPPRARPAAAERALNGDAPVALDSSANVDSGGTTLPPLPSAVLTLDQRAHIGSRIGLDEARRRLGGPAHAIEGMSPLFMGLARGLFPRGADTAQPLVRGVYLDPNGALILLDQQRVAPGSPAPAPGITWTIGDVRLFLHGESGPAILKNLAKRVR